MSIWATRLFLKDETAPFEYDHHNQLGERKGDLEVAWPPGWHDSLRLVINEEFVLLDREQVKSLNETLSSFLQ